MPLVLLFLLFFLQYMISMMYVIPKPVLINLLAKAKEVHEIPLEDIYWTGIVPDAAKIARRNTEGYEYDYIFDRNRIKCPKKDLMAVRYMPPAEFYKYEEDKCYTLPECVPVNAGPSGAAQPGRRRRWEKSNKFFQFLFSFFRVLFLPRTSAVMHGFVVWFIPGFFGYF